MSTTINEAIATVSEITGAAPAEVAVIVTVNGWSIHINGPKGFQTNEMDALDNAVEDARVIAGCL